MAVEKIPQGYHTVTPYLTVPNVEQALAFYSKAFGAIEKVRLEGPDGKIRHAEVRIGNSMVMMGPACPEMGSKAPLDLGGSPVSLMLYVEDVDAFFAHALSSGAEELETPKEVFWGDRMGRLKDPFGYSWAVATHVEDISPEEIKKRMLAQFS